MGLHPGGLGMGLHPGGLGLGLHPGGLGMELRPGGLGMGLHPGGFRMGLHPGGLAMGLHYCDSCCRWVTSTSGDSHLEWLHISLVDRCQWRWHGHTTHSGWQ